jgi:hypothetical protein
VANASALQGSARCAQASTQSRSAASASTSSLRQVESGDVRKTVVTLGKQLSLRWYVG